MNTIINKFCLFFFLIFISCMSYAQEESEGPPLSSESLMEEDFVINPALYDAHIQRTLQNNFDDNPGLSKIYVSSQNGNVKLDGNNNDIMQMDYATSIAVETPLVQSVQTEVEVNQ